MTERPSRRAGGQGARLGGLSGTDFDLNGSVLWQTRGRGRLEVKLERLFQIDQRFLFGMSLARYVKF